MAEGHHVTGSWKKLKGGLLQCHSAAGPMAGKMCRVHRARQECGQQSFGCRCKLLPHMQLGASLLSTSAANSGHHLPGRACHGTHNEVLLGWAVGSPLPLALSMVLHAAHMSRAAASLLGLVPVQRLLHLRAELQRVCLRLPAGAGACLSMPLRTWQVHMWAAHTCGHSLHSSHYFMFLLQCCQALV